MTRTDLTCGQQPALHGSCVVNQGAAGPFYDFFSTDLEQFECEDRVVEVDQSTTGIRPYIVAFAVSGKAVDERLSRI